MSRWVVQQLVESVFKEVERLDGALTNVFTKMGTSADRSIHTRVGVPALLSQVDLNHLYVGSWLCRRIVDIIPSEATRAGWEITLGKDTSQAQRRRFEQLVAEGEAMGLRQQLRTAMEYARLQGGGAVVMVVDDDAPIEQPINFQKLKRIRGLHPMDCWRLWPSSSWSGVGMPEHYEFINNNDQDAARAGLEGPYATFTIHASRVLRFDGDPAPYDMKNHLRWWGISVLQAVWETFKRYETAHASAAILLQDFDLYVHSISGLADMISKGQESQIQARMEAMALGRSVIGGLVIDKDRESADFLSRSVAGVADLMTELKEAVQGASRIPHTKLWGASPSGLGADGRSEDASFAQETLQWQQDHLDRPLRSFYTVLAACSQGNARMELPPDWKIKFHSTFVLSDAEKAELRGKVAVADTGYINAQVLQPHEVAVARFGGAEWTMETNLIDRERDGSIKQQQQDAPTPVFGGDLAPAGGDGSQPDDPAAEAAATENLQGNQQAPGGDAGPGDRPRGDLRLDGREDDCCEPCAAAEKAGEPMPCRAHQADAEQEELEDGDRASVGETMHRWKHGTLHSGTGDPGKHRAEVPYGPEHQSQAVAIALSIAGQARPRRGRGRRRGVRADGSRATGRQLVAGVQLVMQADGTAQLLGAYGNPLPHAVAVGFDRGGIWEVLDANQQWCAVVGVEDESVVRIAAGPDARVRRLDSIDLVAMGVRCDAYDL